MRPLHASDSARMNRMNATKDAATMKVENKIRIFIATPAVVVATTVFLKDNSY
jgi:hypothetical protein